MEVRGKSGFQRGILYFSPLFLLFGCFFVSVEFGTTEVSFTRFLVFGERSSTECQIIGIRVLQSLSVLLAGGALAISGLVLQRIMRNNLVDPGITGVLSGGALGITILSIANPEAFGTFSVSRAVFALAFSLLAGTTLMAVSTVIKDSLKVVIFGVMLNSFLSGATVLVQSFLDPYKLQQTFSFLVGSVAIPSTELLVVNLAVILLSTLTLVLLSRKLDILSLGDLDAHVLGISVRVWRSVFLVLAILPSSVAVSLVGVIGFVGFIVPNILLLLSYRFTTLSTAGMIVLSGAVGGAFLSLCYTVSRILIPLYELPLGVITGLIGAPLFAAIVFRRGKA